jgi:hypothetical protein
MELPVTALMNDITARESSIGFIFQDQEVISSIGAKRTILAIHLLFEKQNPNSKFKPYLGGCNIFES